MFCERKNLLKSTQCTSSILLYTFVSLTWNMISNGCKETRCMCCMNWQQSKSKANTCTDLQIWPKFKPMFFLLQLAKALLSHIHLPLLAKHQVQFPKEPLATHTPESTSRIIGIVSPQSGHLLTYIDWIRQLEISKVSGYV